MGQDSIVLLGVNHKKTPLAIREKLALTGGYEGPLEKLRELDGLKEYYLLSTCNRVEVLFICQDPEQMRREVLDLLFAGKVSREEVAGCIYVYENEEAVRHLFMVSSSLDSMIVGESQILGQLKEAFRHAAEKKTAGMVLNKMLHKSFSVAKRVRTETRIGANAVSISYAAVELGRKIFGDLRGKRVMLVGAGEMAELAAEHLVGQGIQEVVVANRTLERAMKLAARFKGRAVGLDEVVEQLLDVDILISSTGAEGLVLFKKDIASLMPRRRNRPLFFIDIAVPRDLDPKINTLENVYLYDIDDLNNVVEMNREQRDKEAIKARRIVEEETLKFQRWLDGMEVTPTIVDLRAVAESICQAELAKTLPRLNGISSKERKYIERMASSIVGKMLHHPVQYLKTDHSCVDQAERIMQVRTLFQLNEQ
ncbi:glutamyl-tRNA reductase [Candidatus Electrothrix marina]|uniref:Glutamyl-tRNA reductase n=2 Tax=Candidatus Electrothrix marina TaxID=1859130 RepID=A0A444J6D9_9BACT|nr:glutamyl-tRNA reductase [Candidatus Electrothrix marina]